MDEPEQTPGLSRRALLAVIAIAVLPLAAGGVNTVVLDRARVDAGPPPSDAILPLPDGYRIVDEVTGCGPGNWVRCYRVITVVAEPERPSARMLDELVAQYEGRGEELYVWRSGYRNPHCSRDTGTCLAIDPDGPRRARIEVSRMSDGL